MPLSLVTAPEAEPISVEEALEHLRIDGTSDPALVYQHVRAARDLAEAVTKRALMRQTWKYFTDCWPDACGMELPKPPLASVTHVKYYDDDGTLQTLATSVYSVDTFSEPGRITLAYNQTWPSHRPIPNAIEVQYVAGYVTADRVPASIIAGMKLILGHLYENREEVGFLTPNRLPMGALSLLSTYEVMMRAA